MHTTYEEGHTYAVGGCVTAVAAAVGENRNPSPKMMNSGCF